MDALIQLIVVVFLLLVGLSVGSIAERRHFRSLAAREATLFPHILHSNFRSFPCNVPGAAPLGVTGEPHDVSGAQPGSATLVSGECVISSDYFKTFIATLKKIIGGELRSLESLMTRARREAILRMLDQAHRIGCDAVCNIRLDTVEISNSDTGGKKGLTMATVVASGTAYKRIAGAPPATSPSAP